MRLSIALVGCGAMGSALLKGWLTLSASKERFKDFWVVTPHLLSVDPFLGDVRVQGFESPHLLPHSPDLLVFAVKPFLLNDILPLYTSFDSLVLSLAAGKSLEVYEKIFPPSYPIFRVMPNIPVEIHKGVIGLLPNAYVTDNHKSMVDACFQGLGFCKWVKSDDEIDKLTAISGSGPAYVFFMIEALAQSAEALGFDQETAVNLAVYTFWGASAQAHFSDALPSVLCKQVTSPQGTTVAALKVLEERGLQGHIKDAANAAYFRAKELSK